MRTLPNAVKSELFREHGTLAIGSLLELTFGGNTRRFYSDVATDTGSGREIGGMQYEARMHILSLPADRQDVVQENTLLIDNADGELTSFVQSTNIRGEVKQSYAFTTDWESPILGPFKYETVRCDPDEGAGLLILRITHSRILNEPFPRLIFDPSRFPGLF